MVYKVRSTFKFLDIILNDTISLHGCNTTTYIYVRIYMPNTFQQCISVCVHVCVHTFVVRVCVRVLCMHVCRIVLVLYCMILF